MSGVGSPPGVLVLLGGPGAERAVSIQSGRAVAEALRRGGRFRIVERVIDVIGDEELKTMVRSESADVVFPLLHGTWGEGGPLQELLESASVPYVGSPPGPAALAMDKLATKRLVEAEGIATPPACRLEPGAPCPLDPPLVLKPNDDGSSVDLRICRTEDAVAAARRELQPRRGRLLAEGYVAGRELTVAILGRTALPLIEIVPAVEFYDYAAKYERSDTRYRLEPDLPAGTRAACLEWAVLAFERLGCRDLARADFMLDERGPWFLEINTMPGFTAHSLVPMAAAHAGLAMPDLCERLVAMALGRTRAERADPAPARAGSLEM